MDDEEEEWDLAAIDELEKKAHEANAARRSTQAYPSSFHISARHPTPSSSPSPSTSFLAPPFYSTAAFMQASNARNPLPHLQEPQKLQEVLQEKEGAISLLRSRLKQTEQELYELRRRLSTQTFAQSTPRQQREVEHLSSQLMFKDQEIMEVKRVCVEKEEQVKNAFNTVAALRQDLETLKRKRHHDIVEIRVRETFGNQSCQEKAVENTKDVLGPKEPLSGCIPEINNDTLDAHSAQNLSKGLHDQWVVPWPSQNVDKNAPNMSVQKPPDDSLEMPNKSISINLPKINCFDSSQFPSKISALVNPSEFRDLDERTETRPFFNGGSLSSEKSKSVPFNEVENHELVRKPTVAQHYSKGQEPPGVGAQSHCRGSGSFTEIDEGNADLSHALNAIWKAKDAKDAGSDLVGKVFAHCQQQLHTLLKFDGSHNALEQVSHEKEGEANKGPAHESVIVKDASRVSLKLHSALASVANGLASSVTLLGPLIEFCNCLDHSELVQSSVCLISCIVQHDHSCREKLLGRSSHLQSMGMGSHSKTFSKKMNVNIEGSGWFIMDTKEWSADSSQTVSDRSTDTIGLFFSSQRIICRPKEVGVKSAMKVHAPYVLDKQSKHEADNVVELNGKVALAQSYEGGDCDPCFFVSWALQLAISSTNPGIRFEMVNMMRCLLMHTEPLTERAQFASTLFREQLFSMLKKGAGVLVQLQTLKLVHLLLHCPDTLNRICQDKGTKDNPNNVASGGEVFGHGTELLEGLATCISFTGVSMQEYALRRFALRMLAFIATSGDAGVEFLLRGISSVDSENSERPTKEGQHEGPKKIPSNNSSKKASDEKLGCLQVDSNDPAKTDLTDTHTTKQNILYRLVILIEAELSVDEDQVAATTSTERASLILEALKFLCRLASHPLHSSTVVALLSSDKSTLRTCVNVMNRLIRRGSQIDASQNSPNSSLSTPNVIDLAKSLRRKVVAGASL